MAKLKIIGLLVGCAAVAALAPAQQIGSISGMVADENGAPVAGALILYHSIPTLTRDAGGHAVASGRTVSSALRAGEDGTFAISSLADGLYSVCAYGTTPTELGSCDWGGKASPVRVAGGAATDIALQLREGKLLTFLVSDPNGVIRDRASGPFVNGRMPLYGGNFRIGVMLGPIYARAEFASQQGTVRTYTVAVPRDVTLDLIADTSLLVTAGTGATVPLRQEGFSIAIDDSAAQVVNLDVR